MEKFLKFKEKLMIKLCVKKLGLDRFIAMVNERLDLTIDEKEIIINYAFNNYKKKN